MSSGLITRYAQVTGKPLPVVERLWRDIKREFNANGCKKEYDSCVRKLRERLNIKRNEGRTAYLNEAPVTILSETPEWALIQVDLELVEDVDLQSMLFSSNGVMTARWNMLSHKKGGPLLEIMTPGYVAPNPGQKPGQNQIKTATPAVTAQPAATPQTAPGAMNNGLNGIVNYKGRQAVVVTMKDPTHSHIRYLDNNEEEDVVTAQLQMDKQAMESVQEIWSSINPGLSEEDKLRMFEAIVKMEFSIDYLPESLREDVQELINPGALNIGSEQTKNVEDDSDKLHQDAGKRRDYKFDESDWKLIFKVRGDDDEEEKAAAENNPMPDPPEEDDGERKEGPADSKIPPASEDDVHGMLRNMRAARESYNQGARGSWSTDSPRINLSEMRKAAEKEPTEEPQSVMEKNLHRAHMWESHFSDDES